MEMFIPIIVLIIVVIIVTIYIVNRDRFKENIIRLNEADASIDAVLNKRFDLLKKAEEIIDKEVNKDKENEKKIEVMHTIVEIRSKNLSKFEFDSSLYKAIDELNKYSEEYSELKKDNEFVKIQVNLIESESEILALRKYYNDISKTYNKLLQSFPASIIGFFKRYKKMQYFDIKDSEKEVLEELKA